MKMTKKLVSKLLGELEKHGIVQYACEKYGVSRNTFYKWLKKYPDFLEGVDEAKTLGTGTINDMAESNLITGIKNKNMDSTKYWLSHRHPDFRRPYVHKIDNDPIEHSRILKDGQQKAQVKKDIETATTKKSEAEIAEKKAQVKRMMDSWTKSDVDEKTKVEKLAKEMMKEWIKNNHDPFKDNSDDKKD